MGKLILQYAPRSYVVAVDFKLISCNRKFLRTTSEPYIVLPGCDNFNFDDYSNFQDRDINNERTTVPNPPIQSHNNEFFNVKRTRTRVIRPPARYQDYVIN